MTTMQSTGGRAMAGVLAAWCWMGGLGAQTSAGQTAPPPKLPAVVAAAFERAYPTATIKHVVHETEDGQEQYEIESIDHGKGLDVSYKPDGTLLVVEEEVTQADLPAAVTAAIASRYPKAPMTKCERATENKQVSYEIALTGGPVKSVELTADGRWISPKLPK